MLCCLQCSYSTSSLYPLRTRNHVAFQNLVPFMLLKHLKKQGFILGMLDTFDRLMRCNGLSPEKYPLDYNSRLLIDPVRNIHYEEL